MRRTRRGFSKMRVGSFISCHALQNLVLTGGLLQLGEAFRRRRLPLQAFSTVVDQRG